MATATVARNYEAVIARLSPSGSREQRMQACVDALWDEVKDKGCSWVGFYIKMIDEDQFVLGPRRDKPACSPISLHGACGRCFQSRRPLIVTNVANLRAGYIACDPRDRSECVMPLFDGPDTADAVLDLDSYETDAFRRDDIVGLHKLLRHMELTAEAWPAEIDFV